MLIKTVFYSSLLSLFIATNVNAQVTMQHPGKPQQLQFVKKNNIKKNEGISVLKDGIYEFKVISESSNGEAVQFYRILIINTAKFPEFRFEFSYGDIIQTPVSYTWNDDSWHIDESLYLLSLNTNSETQQPVITIDNEYGLGHKKLLAFTNATSGDELSEDDNYIKQKTGSFQLTKFTKLDDLNLEYVHYQARIRKVSNDYFPTNSHCPRTNYEGIAGFIRIPESFAEAGNGWIAGFHVKHGPCSIRISHSLAGRFKKGLLTKNSLTSFIVTQKDSVRGSGGWNQLIFINGLPDNNQHLNGTIYLNEIYETVPQILNLEMDK